MKDNGITPPRVLKRVGSELGYTNLKGRHRPWEPHKYTLHHPWKIDAALIAMAREPTFMQMLC